MSERNPHAPSAGRAADHADREPAPEKYACDLCGWLMYERHCRIVCPKCGYQRDCSDP